MSEREDGAARSASALGALLDLSESQQDDVRRALLHYGDARAKRAREGALKQAQRIASDSITGTTAAERIGAIREP